MKIYHRYGQTVRQQYSNGEFYIIHDWSQCDSDAVFSLHFYEIPRGRSLSVGDRIKSKHLPWEVRVVAFPMLEPGIMVVRADAYPLMWVWRVLQWQIENPLKWWLFKQFKKIG